MTGLSDWLDYVWDGMHVVGHGYHHSASLAMPTDRRRTCESLTTGSKVYYNVLSVVKS